jgi:hypothetical protein
MIRGKPQRAALFMHQHENLDIVGKYAVYMMACGSENAR